MGVLYGSMKCLKYCTFIFNFLVFIIGLSISSLGFYAFYGVSNYSGDIENVAKPIGVILMVIGFIIVFVGFFGCCGSCYENVCMLITFATVITILLCLQIAIFVVVFIYKDEAFSLINGAFKAAFDRDDFSVKDTVQRELKCCGYETVPAIIDVRNSCCGDAPICTPFNTYKTTCASAIADRVTSVATTILITTAVLFALQFTAIIVACCLQYKIRNPL